MKKPIRMISGLDIHTIAALEKMYGVEIVDAPPKDENELMLPELLEMAVGKYSPKPEKTEQDLIRDEEKKRNAEAKRVRKALKKLSRKV